MAKVMVSLPDELLARIDAYATEAGITSSAALRALAEAALGERQRKLATRMVELQTGVTGHGGDVADTLRQAEAVDVTPEHERLPSARPRASPHGRGNVIPAASHTG